MQLSVLQGILNLTREYNFKRQQIRESQLSHGVVAAIFLDRNGWKIFQRKAQFGTDWGRESHEMNSVC